MDVETREARHMALRYLIGDILAEICRMHDNPGAYADAWKKRNLDALDHTFDRRSELGDVFNHNVLHEVETMWRNVRGVLPPPSQPQAEQGGG